jgi:hypothetical protein
VRIKLRKTTEAKNGIDRSAETYTELKTSDLENLFDKFYRDSGINSMKIDVLFSDNKVYIKNQDKETPTFTSVDCEHFDHTDGLDFSDGKISELLV